MMQENQYESLKTRQTRNMRKILEYVLKLDKPFTVRDVATALNMSADVVRFNLIKLANNGLLYSYRLGRVVIYSTKQLDNVLPQRHMRALRKICEKAANTLGNAFKLKYLGHEVGISPTDWSSLVRHVFKDAIISEKPTILNREKTLEICKKFIDNNWNQPNKT